MSAHASSRWLAPRRQATPDTPDSRGTPSHAAQTSAPFSTPRAVPFGHAGLELCGLRPPAHAACPILEMLQT